MAPVGFSLSLYFIQRMSEHLFCSSLGADSTLLRDLNSPFVLDPSAAGRLRTNQYVYVDNIGFFSFDEGTVSSKLSEAVSDFHIAGLLLHETSVGTGDREALGTVLACSSFHY